MNIAKPSPVEGALPIEGAETGPMAGDAPLSAPVPSSGVSDGHEALLLRHGVISHVAELDPGSDGVAIAGFLRDMSKLAQNTIRLSDNRYGLLLQGAPPPAAAPVLRWIRPETPKGDEPEGGWPEEGGPDEDWPEGEGPPAADAPATGDAVAAAPEALVRRMPDALSHEALADILGPLLEAALHTHLAPLADAHAALREERARWRDDTARFWEGMEAVLRMLSDTAARLNDTEAALTAAGARAGDQVQNRTGDQMGPTRADVRDVMTALADLETAVAIGFEASGAVRDANYTAVEEHFAALKGQRGVTRADLAVELAPLHGALDALREGPAGAPPDDTSVRADLADLRQALAALQDSVAAVDARLPPAANDGAAPPRIQRIEDGVAGLVSALADHARVEDGANERLLAQLDGLRAALDAAGTAEEGFARLESHLAELKASLSERGGVLSDTVETSCRSMKNFWLASEDVLQRLDTALDRARSSRSLDAADGGPEGDGADPSDGASGSGAVVARLSELETRLAKQERDSYQSRHVLAEMLALQLNGASQDEDEDEDGA